MADPPLKTAHPGSGSPREHAEQQQRHLVPGRIDERVDTDSLGLCDSRFGRHGFSLLARPIRIDTRTASSPSQLLRETIEFTTIGSPVFHRGSAKPTSAFG